MSNPGSAAKSATPMLNEENIAGKKLFAENVKLEESHPSEKGLLFQEINEALRIPAEQGDVVDEAAEEHHFVKTLLEEMSGLEADHEQFEATTRLLRRNLEQHVGNEE